MIYKMDYCYIINGKTLTSTVYCDTLDELDDCIKKANNFGYFDVKIVSIPDGDESEVE